MAMPKRTENIMKVVYKYLNNENNDKAKNNECTDDAKNSESVSNAYIYLWTENETYLINEQWQEDGTGKTQDFCKNNGRLSESCGK